MERAPAGLTLRRAGDEDARGLAALWNHAFPGERSAEERIRDLEAGSVYGGLETAWVAEGDGGRRAGAFRIYDLELHLRGRPFRTMGLAAVAVEPEWRRRGVGRWMCREALRLGREEGAVLALLYPYRVDFYARLGFTSAGELHRYRFHPEELPTFPGREAVVRADPAEVEELVARLYAQATRRRNGLLTRPREAWRHLYAPNATVLLHQEAAGEPSAYAVVHPGPGPVETGPALHVRELLALEMTGYRALLGWISAQRGAWRHVVYDALPGEGFHRILGHPRLPGTGTVRDLWFQSAVLLRGPMLRILNLEALLTGTAQNQGDAVLPVLDSEVPENAGVWTLGEGEAVRARKEAGEGGVPIRVLTDLLVSGTLPGGPRPAEEWEPALGLEDFQTLDTF